MNKEKIINSPLLWECFVPDDKKLEEIKKIIIQYPLSIFQELNKFLNKEKWLIIMIDLLP